MLRDFGRAQKRATEVRDELIGVVASQVPVSEVKEKISSAVISPLTNAKESLKSTWNSGVNTVFSKVNENVAPSTNAPRENSAPANAFRENSAPANAFHENSAPANAYENSAPASPSNAVPKDEEKNTA